MLHPKNVSINIDICEYLQQISIFNLHKLNFQFSDRPSRDNYEWLRINFQVLFPTARNNFKTSYNT